MRKASVVVLAFVGVAMLLLSFVSAYTAYCGNYTIGQPPVSVAQVAQDRPGLESGLRGIRATSAAFAGAFAALWLAIVFVPYKRGEVWAWWALAASVLLLNAMILLRVPLLETRLGIAAGLTVLVLSTVGLLLDVSRLRAARA
jgi:hypothetical protein